METLSHGQANPKPALQDDLYEHFVFTSRPIRIQGLSDPSKKVVVKPSTLPGAGLGLFAAKDLVTFADRVTNGNAHKYKIAPYLGVSNQVIGEEAFSKISSDYIISVDGVSVD